MTQLKSNVKIFVDHLHAGLEQAGLNFDDYNPTTVTQN